MTRSALLNSHLPGQPDLWSIPLVCASGFRSSPLPCHSTAPVGQAVPPAISSAHQLPREANQ